MSCGQRITELMKNKRLTQQEVADKIGVARQSISLWQKDKTVPSGTNLERLASALGTTSGYLLFGLSDSSIKTFDQGDTPPDDVVVIHEYRLTFGASPSGVEPVPEWELVDDGDDYWYKRTFFQKRHLNPDRCKRARVSGDSMEPTICDGDTFLFYEECDSRPGCVIIADGQIYAISVEGQLKVKRLSKTKDGIVVRSDNPDYQPEIYSGDDLSKLRIYGKVIEINRAF